jgi:hypothetical protein
VNADFFSVKLLRIASVNVVTYQNPASRADAITVQLHISHGIFDRSTMQELNDKTSI